MAFTKTSHGVNRPLIHMKCVSLLLRSVKCIYPPTTLTTYSEMGNAQPFLSCSLSSRLYSPHRLQQTSVKNSNHISMSINRKPDILTALSLLPSTMLWLPIFLAKATAFSPSFEVQATSERVLSFTFIPSTRFLRWTNIVVIAAKLSFFLSFITL